MSLSSSLWNETARCPGFSVLDGDAKTDVLIVGGGIAGLLTAYFLRENGVRCLVAEKDRICCGTTGNTTAKITYQHGLMYGKLLRSMGAENAKMYLEANRMAFEKYRELCGSIPCDFETRDNYVYSESRRALEEEMNALSKIGYNAVLRDSLPIPVNAAGAVCFKDQAQFHPLKFLYAIAEKLDIYEQTAVRDIEGGTAFTDRGRIRAEKIIVMTHFPFIDRHGGYFIKLYQHRSYVIALENAADVGGMYVSDCKTGLSFRNYGGLLLLGGGGHRTGKRGGGWAELRGFAKKHYPRSEEKYFWAAQDCMSLDNMPYIGIYSKGTPSMYTASGFNKWGMTGAMLSAILLSDAVCGRHNDYERIFDPSRNILKPQLFVNGFESAKGLVTPWGKRCTHLGCSLKYNHAEHSWDCPCHGSRFSVGGEVLEDPAERRLK